VESETDHVSRELEDLTLEDEKFAVKTLSHNTARQYLVSGSLSWQLLTLWKTTPENSLIGTSPKKSAKELMSVWPIILLWQVSRPFAADFLLIGSGYQQQLQEEGRH
jgi:hypothetical protein